jgi:hypothetical protein
MGEYLAWGKRKAIATKLFAIRELESVALATPQLIGTVMTT